MDRASWLKLFDRWLKPMKGNSDNIDNGNVINGIPLPCIAGALVPLSHCPDSTSKPPVIIVGVAPDGGFHSGHYLIPDVEACVLCGDDGVHLIPWPHIICIRIHT